MSAASTDEPYLKVRDLEVEFTTEDGKEVGELTTVVPGRAIAYLRFDRAKGPLMAGDTRVIREG